MADTVLIETTQKVAGETHYFGEPLALGIIAALIVIGIICIAKMWHRRHSPNSSDSAVPDLHNPQKQKGEDPSSIIISSSWSSGEEHVYYPPPPPLQNGQKLKPLSINRVETKQQQQLQNVLPKLQETHLCPHSRENNPKETIQYALHAAPIRPKPMTPPPSNATTPTTLSSQKSSQTHNSARSITPRRHLPHHSYRSHHNRNNQNIGNKVAPKSEQKSEDINEQSSTTNMMAMNKMTKEDAKRMRRPIRRPIRKPIRRPQPVSAEAITAAAASGTSSNDGQTLPSEDLKDHRQHLFSQEHIVDYQKNEEMLKSDNTQNDEAVEMPTKQK